MPDAKALAESCIVNADAMQCLNHQREDFSRIIIPSWQKEGVVLVAEVMEDRPPTRDALEDGNAAVCTQGDCTLGGRVLVAPALDTFGVGVEEQPRLIGEWPFAEEPFC